MDEAVLPGRIRQESGICAEITGTEGKGLGIRCKDHVYHQGSDERQSEASGEIFGRAVGT